MRRYRVRGGSLAEEEDGPFVEYWECRLEMAMERERAAQIVEGSQPYEPGDPPRFQESVKRVAAQIRGSVGPLDKALKVVSWWKAQFSDTKHLTMVAQAELIKAIADALGMNDGK